MLHNTKLLVVISVLIILSGFGFLWFGIQPESSPVSSPSPIVEEVKESTQSGVVGIEGERVVVTKVVDGDTIQIDTGQTVRLIGVDTPETVNPRRPVGCFGKEASNQMKSLLLKKEIIMQKDVSDTDKYKRLLRYIYLPQEGGESLFINDYLVREGFGLVLTYPPDVKFNEQFREAEIQARQLKKGLWAKC